MDLFGKIEKLTKLLLQKSGKTVTIDSPSSVATDHTFVLPDVIATGTSTLIDSDSSQALSNKTLVLPVIASLANANHTHADAAGGGQLTNAAIASAAAIARSKMASGTIGAVVINNGSGIMTDEAVLAKSRGGFGIDMTNFTPGVTATKVIKVDNSLPGTDPVLGVKVYQTVQGAIDAAVAAGATNADMYLIDIAPGTYIENITLYNGIVLKGSSTISTIIQGSISSHAGLSIVGAKCSVQDIEFQHTPAVPGISFNLIGAISTHLVNFLCFPVADVAVIGLHCAPAAGQTAIHGLCSVYMQPLVPFTSDIHVWENNGAGLVSAYSSSSYLVSNQTAGNICVIDEEGSGIRNYNNIAALAQLTSAVYSGTVRGFCTESASTGTRLSQGGQVRLIGAGSGTAIAFNLDTGTDVSDFLFTGSTAFIDGFSSEYVSYTSVNAVQKVWLNSVNKDLPKSGTGRSIITPYDERKSGFVEWGAVTASNYWSISGSNFTVVAAGVGIIRGAPIAFNGNQTVALASGVNYIYMTSTGVINKVTSPSESLYSDNIVLFQVWYDGTNTRVFKENHPYKFESAVSHAWHRLFGVLLEGTGAIIGQYGAASARTINLTGADVLTDHGLDTTIPDSNAAAIALTIVYKDGSGTLKAVGAPSTAIPGKYNPATGASSGTLADTTSTVVWRIVVGKDDIEGPAQYFAIPHNAVYTNASAANNAIANATLSGSIAPIPAELKMCECAMIGWVVINAATGGLGSIDTVTSARQTFGAAFAGGGFSNQANLVTISDIAGPIIDTSTTVQAALSEANTNAMKVAVSGTSNALVRFDGTSGQLTARALVTCDGAGNMAGVLTVNSHAIPSGTGAIVTVDSADTLTNKILTTPTIGSFLNANHDHSASGAAGGLVIAASATQQGTVSVSAQTFAGLKTFASGVAANTIVEVSAGSGVSIDSVLLKDGTVQASSTDANKLPVGTSAERAATGAGVIRFNSTLGCVESHNGTSWVPSVKYASVALASGTVDLYTPETGVVSYQAMVYTTAGTGTAFTTVMVVNKGGTWEYGATEVGDTVITPVLATGTGKLSLTAAATGTAKATIHIVI